MLRLDFEPAPNLLDSVEELLPLLIVHKLIVEAVYRFAENRPQPLGFRYTGGGHEVHPFVVQSVGVLVAPAALIPFINDVFSVLYYLLRVK